MTHNRLSFRRGAGAPTAFAVLAAAALTLTACSSGPASVSGTSWNGDNDASIVFNEDGTFTGNDGCNTGPGSWTEADKKVSFSDIATTNMYCGDIDMWLDLAATGEIKSGKLVVSDKNGEEIATLTQAK